jgi:hypothetical protein
MEERLRKALEDLSAIARQSRLLSLGEQGVVVARLETLVSELRWELLFHLPASQVAGTSAEVTLSVDVETAGPASAM